MDGDYEHILYSTEDGITTVTLNRPEVFNAFNRKMGEELQSALECFKMSRDEWFCILTGAGKAFCSGEDLKNIDLDLPAGEQARNTCEALDSYQGIVYSILGTPKPIVAALNGTAAGAGLSIALACDERFAISGDKNMLVPGFGRIGLVPDAGMVPLLQRLVGYRRAKEWLEPGFGISMKEACDSRDLVSTLYDNTETMLAGVKEYALCIRESRSLAEFGSTKILMVEGMMDILDKIFYLELELQTRLELGDDFREGLAAFKEKRKPNFNRVIGPLTLYEALADESEKAGGV